MTDENYHLPQESKLMRCANYARATKAEIKVDQTLRARKVGTKLVCHLTRDTVCPTVALLFRDFANGRHCKRPRIAQPIYDASRAAMR
jgi:hypothetical protein